MKRLWLRICLVGLVFAALGALTGCGFRLMVAAETGDTKRIRVLLDDGMDVNQQLPLAGTRALILAAGKGHLETVRLLLEQGADVNATDLTGWTALHAAASQGHKEIVQLLLAHAATINHTNVILGKPLRWAEGAEHPEIVEMLKQAEAEQDSRKKTVAQRLSTPVLPSSNTGSSPLTGQN